MKLVKVADLRQFEQMLRNEQVTYSRAVEILNTAILERLEQKIIPLIEKMEATDAYENGVTISELMECHFLQQKQ